MSKGLKLLRKSVIANQSYLCSHKIPIVEQ